MTILYFNQNHNYSPALTLDDFPSGEFRGGRPIVAWPSYVDIKLNLAGRI